MPFRPRDPRLLHVGLVCALLTLFCLGFATQGHCQERPRIGRLTVTLGGYMALAGVDAGMTASCLAAHRCREKNPVLAPLAGRPAALATVKLAASAGLATGIWRLGKSHPRAAFLAGVAAVAVQGAVVAANARSLRAQQGRR